MQVYFQMMINYQIKLIDAGEKVEEKVWRMPLNKNFDKLMTQKMQICKI